MRHESRTLIVLGGPHEGHTIDVPASVQAVVLSSPNDDETINLSPARTAAPPIHTTYTVHPTLPYATTPDVDLDDYTTLREALAKLRPGKPPQ